MWGNKGIERGSGRVTSLSFPINYDRLTDEGSCESYTSNNELFTDKKSKDSKMAIVYGTVMEKITLFLYPPTPSLPSSVATQKVISRDVIYSGYKRIYVEITGILFTQKRRDSPLLRWELKK